MAINLNVKDIMKETEKSSGGGNGGDTQNSAAAPADNTVKPQTNLPAEGAKKDLLDALDAIDNKYNGTAGGENYPDSLGLSQMEYDAPSDDDLNSLAQSQLTQKQIDGQNAINENTDRQKDDLADYKTAQEKSFAEQSAAVQKQYEERRREAEKDALRRGLARSSIITGKIEEFDKGKIGDEQSLNAKLSDALTNIDFQIASLETARGKALNDFNLAFAAELNNKIDELKTARQGKIDEVLKYNNSVAQKESEYQFKKAEAERKALQEAANPKNQGDLAALILNEKLAAVKDYYAAMSPADALKDFLKDSTMSYHLKEYYNYMLQYLQMRVK